MINTYLQDIKKIDRLYHVSDIHIRNFKRHEEYRKVFGELRKEITSTSNEYSLIVLTGDIVHSKTDVTPELMYQVQDFLKGLADIRPVLLIPGNHDANLNNEHRMDSLTPIVEALNHKNLVYVKDSEVFNIGGITFCHWSVFDDNYKQASEIDGEIKVCLYHGSVQSAYTDIGFKLEGGKITPGHFHGFDLALLGDIHKFQYLNEAKTIAYPGSLIQQNHGESLEHGILVWNVNDKTSEYVKINNDTGFYTLYVESGKHSSIPDEVPENVYLRIRHTDTNQNQLKSLIADIKKSRRVVELSLQRMNNAQEIANLGTKNGRFLDVRDEQQQNILILDYISKKIKLTEDQKDQIKTVNAYINQQLPKLEASRNVIWNPKRFEFENMFSYGKENVMDFEGMRGTYGIFAANASGKSTLLDAISYCIFDKCSKTTRSSQVLNSSSNTFYCKLDFELNGKHYVIERDGLREKNGNVRVKVNFYYFEEGNKVSLNGKERNDTNAAIRAVLGSYEDFALTALSTQGSNTGFIDMNQKDRKELLSQFLDINAFETLYDVANNEMKDVQAVMKQYQKIDHASAVRQIDESKEELEKSVEDLKTKKETLQKDKDSLNKRILDEHILLTPVSSKVVNEQELSTKIDSLKRDMEACSAKIEEIKNKKIEYEKRIQSVKDSMKKMDLGDYGFWKSVSDQKLKQLDEAKAEFSRLSSNIKEIEIHLNHHQSKLDKLKELEYDENCSYCMNNVFVKDAISTKKSYEEDEVKRNELRNALERVVEKVNDLLLVKKEREAYELLMKDLDHEEKNLLVAEADMHKQESLCSQKQNELDNVQKELDTFKSEKKIIENNSIIQKRINDYEVECKVVDQKLKDATEELTSVLLSINSLNTKRDEHTNALMELMKQQAKYDVYKMYAEAVHRDGAPHEIISNIIPQIQDEINAILEQLVEFKVILVPDEKNINAYIAYDNDRYWPIELTSGMEKFVAGLAIRSSLINISSLPRPSFIAIDEGFGALDNNNLGSIVSYFDHLKNQFKFIMIISHIDSMRDAVDHHIEINKIQGRSNVQHVS